MAANPLTIVSNNPAAAKQTGVGRHEMKEMSGGNDGVAKIFLDSLGIVAEIGRGETDTDITYVALFNSSGTKMYIYPNAAADGLVTTTTKP